MSNYLKRCVDKETGVNEPLRGIYIRSFAYPSLKDRTPIILTSVIDHLSREKESIVQKYGEGAREELKTVIGNISKLKSELQTNKPFSKIESGGEGADHYNRLIDEKTKRDGEVPTWYYVEWLFAECYLYRRLREIFETTEYLQKYDIFEAQKVDVYYNSLSSIKEATILTLDFSVQKLPSLSKAALKKLVIDFIKLSLWSNRADLSLSGGEVTEQDSICSHLVELDKFILVDDSEKAYHALTEKPANGQPKILDIILDNAGFELYFDLCLSDLLLSAKIVTHVRFHAKNCPWFVSDTNPHDFYWMITTTKESEDPALRTIGTRWQGYVDEGKFSVETDEFWTLSSDFDKMKTERPTLYKKLGESALVIIKGDLNYRKLVADINRPYTTPFSKAIGSFHPNKLLSLRTMKCDVAAGLLPGQAEKCAAIHPNWIITGEFATIQFDGPSNA
uniref:Sugar phosphate phosphatase n=2 Tax=Cacopsylla melanoneura TaxID=428564 RepID=A0A8D8UIG1_9HEMI